MFLISVVGLAGFWLSYRLGGVAFFFFSLVFVYVLLAFTFAYLSLPMWLLLIVSGFIGKACKVHPKNYAFVMLGVVVLSWGGIYWYAWRNVAHPDIFALREEYPEVDLKTRLAYESRSKPPAVKVPYSRPTELQVELESLVELELHVERRESGYHRRVALGSLSATHHMTVAEFIGENGFGFSRMAYTTPKRKYIDLPDLEPIPFKPGPQVFSAEELDQDVGMQNPVGIISEGNPFTYMHAGNIANFVNVTGFGYIRNPAASRGFQGHGFREYPKLSSDDSDKARWQVVRLELVSLLKHDTPRVYLSENLPRMEELIDAPTRSTDSFEEAALEKLWNKEELVVSRGTNTIRIMGSIRCIQQCTQCHKVEEGALLGAFSYELRRVPAVPEKKPKHDPRVSLLFLDH